MGGAGGLRAAWGPPTADETQAGCVEQVLLQVVLTELRDPSAAPPPSRTPPARRPGSLPSPWLNSAFTWEGEGAGVTGQGHRRPPWDRRHGGPEGGRGRATCRHRGLDLVHLRPALQAAAEGVPVRHETTTNSGCRQRKMAASTMALASRGRRRCGPGAAPGWSGTPLVQNPCKLSGQSRLESHSSSLAQPRPTHQSPGAGSRSVHRLDVWTVYVFGEELHCLQRERGRASCQPAPCLCAPRLPHPPLPHRLLWHVWILACKTRFSRGVRRISGTWKGAIFSSRAPREEVVGKARLAGEAPPGSRALDHIGS